MNHKDWFYIVVLGVQVVALGVCIWAYIDVRKNYNRTKEILQRIRDRQNATDSNRPIQ